MSSDKPLYFYNYGNINSLYVFLNKFVIKFKNFWIFNLLRNIIYSKKSIFKKNHTFKWVATTKYFLNAELLKRFRKT